MAEKKTKEAEVFDPWKVKRTISLPRAPRGEETYRYATVGDRSFQIPRDGKPYVVPLPIYEVLVRAEEAAMASDDYKREKADEFVQKAKEMGM